MIIFRAGVKGDVSSFLFFCFIGEKDNEKDLALGRRVSGESRFSNSAGAKGMGPAWERPLESSSEKWILQAPQAVRPRDLAVSRNSVFGFIMFPYKKNGAWESAAALFYHSFGQKFAHSFRRHIVAVIEKAFGALDNEPVHQVLADKVVGG